MHRQNVRQTSVVIVALLVLLSTFSASASAGGHASDSVAAKQIVFVSGEQFLADGRLDPNERRVLGDSLIVPGGGVAYDKYDVYSGDTSFVSPYFAAKDHVFLSKSWDAKNGIDDSDLDLLRHSVVLVPHTKFALNGERVALTPPVDCPEKRCETRARLVRGHSLPDWFDQLTITGFGSFETPSGTTPPGLAPTNDAFAKQIVFLSAGSLTGDRVLSEAELDALDGAYVITPAGYYPEHGMPIEDIFGEGVLPHSLFAALDDATGGLEYAPIDAVLTPGPVEKGDQLFLDDVLIVAPGATYLQEGDRVQGLTTYIVIDKDTTMVGDTGTTTDSPIWLLHAAPDDSPDWLTDSTGELVTNPDNMVTNPDNMVTNPDNMAPSDPMLLVEGSGLVFVMPGDNVQVPGGGVAFLPGEAGENQRVIAIFQGSPTTFLTAKKAFDAAAFPGDDTPIVADPGDEVVVDPGNEVIADPGDENGVTPGREIPAPERETSPGGPTDSGDQALKNTGHGSLDGEDQLFATRVRKAFDGGYGYGFIAVDIDTGTVVSGYVADDVLITDPDRMDPDTAQTLLASLGASDPDDLDP